MADLRSIEDQLKAIGCNYRFWGRAELRELAHVLLPGEKIKHCVNGQYEGGFAMLCATDQRVLLVDKKPMYLTLEDIRFDMIAELDYNHRLINANVSICTPNKALRFTAYNHGRLRQLFNYTQQRVMEIRQHYMNMGQQQTQPQQIQQQPAAYAPMESAPQVQQTAAALPQQFGLQAAPALTQVQQQPQPHQHNLTAPATAIYHRMVPVISAYTRMPLMSRQRRFLGSRAMNTPMPSIYQTQQ
jgi:hypothetical protein